MKPICSSVRGAMFVALRSTSVREESKVQAIRMKFLRAIMGKTKRDRIRNVHIREEVRMEDIQNQIEGNRLT
jgi:hypothetical protein